MRTPLALLSTLLLAATAAAQGQAFYIPDNDATAGTCNVIPWGTTATSGTWANQRYQCIATVADLGGTAGYVTGLGFAPCASGTHTSQTLRITMAHVPPGFAFAGNTDFDNNLNVLGTNATVVLEQDNYYWEKIGNTWSSVGLDTSFLYNGTDDLLIDILVTGNDASNGSSSTHRNTRERLYAFGWTGSPPATGSAASGALKMQIQMGCADMTIYGPSCGGLQLTLSGSPALGATLTIDAAGGAPNMPIVLNLGFLNTAPFPIDLTPFGFRGCSILNSSDGTIAGLTNAAGGISNSLSVPQNTSLIGVRVFEQYVHLNPQGPGGVALSNGGRVVLGSRCP